MLEQIVEKTNFKDIVIVIIGSAGLVGFWRGVWGLMDLYLFTNNPAVSYGVSVAFGISVLLAIAWYRKDRFKKVEKQVERAITQ